MWKKIERQDKASNIINCRSTVYPIAILENGKKVFEPENPKMKLNPKITFRDLIAPITKGL